MATNKIHTETLITKGKKYYFTIGMTKFDKPYLKLTEKNKQKEGDSLQTIIVFHEDIDNFLEKVNNIGNKIKELIPINENKTYNKIRTTYPNAYKSWEIKDDEMLKEFLKTDMRIKQIALEMGRQAGAITSRIKKLGI
jgi:hypothetical protein